MMMRDDSSDILRHEIDRRIKIVADSLLSNDQVKAKENMEWIELATAVGDKLNKRPYKIKIALVIGLVSVLLIGLGLTLRTPRTKISVHLISKNIGVTLQKRWTLNNRFSSSELSISNLREFYWAGANIRVRNGQPFTLEINGQDIVIDKFDLDSNSEFTIQIIGNKPNFTFKDESLVTDIQFANGRINVNDAQLDTTLNSEIPQLINIRSFKSKGMPVNVMLSDTSNWNIRDIPISDIRFWEESLPASGKFLSSIVSGSVKVLEIDREVELQQGDWLLFDDLRLNRIQLAKTGSHLTVHLEGDVAKASVGSEMFQRVLNPTIIEYLYYAKSFAFFWSSMIFIWSLLWSFKNTLFNR
ncbi:hypothetical protein GZH53_09025 [Flavihumibacter sp. R14]|nr:hypothetical protein [Flavihumibacter soli]